MQKTRVAVVLPDFRIGGAETMVSRLVSHLDLSQLDVEVICISGDRLDNHLEHDVEDHGVPIRYLHKKPGFSFSAFFKLGKELSRFKPDIVHSHLAGGFYSSLWILTHRRKMMIQTVHSVPTLEFEKAKRMVFSALYKRGKAVPVAITETIKSLVRKEYKVKKNVELIFNPVDVGKFSSEKKIKHDNFTFIMAGRLSKEKNQILGLKAFNDLQKDHPDVRLLLLGDGPEREALEDFINKNSLKEKVQLVGAVDNVHSYMAKADAFLLSSEYEGLPLVLLEAMASKLLVVSTDVGGIRDIVDGCSLLTPKGDVQALRDAMEKALSDSEMRKEFCEKAFERVGQYDVSVIADQYTKLYQKYREN